MTSRSEISMPDLDGAVVRRLRLGANLAERGAPD